MDWSLTNEGSTSRKVKTGTESEDVIKTACCQCNSLSNMACTEAYINIAVINSVLLVSNTAKYYGLVSKSWLCWKEDHVFSHTIYLLNTLCSLNLHNLNPTQKIMFQKVTQWNLPIITQRDATIYSLFTSVNCATCFRWYLHPSSAAHVTVSTASVISKTVTATFVNMTGRQLFLSSRFHESLQLRFPSSHVHERLQLRSS
jgi:hypothetical protein